MFQTVFNRTRQLPQLRLQLPQGVLVAPPVPLPAQAQVLLQVHLDPTVEEVEDHLLLLPPLLLPAMLHLLLLPPLLPQVTKPTLFSLLLFVHL
jgi:hypothetical protein